MTDNLLALQHSAGNTAVASLVRRLQPVSVQRQSHGHPAGGRRGSAVEQHFTVNPEEYWDLHPHHLMQAASQLGMHGREAGLTQPEPAFDYTAMNGRVNRVVVTCPVTVTMPRWTESTRLPPAARDEWGRFIGALRAHEQGHVDIARTFFEHYGAVLLHRSEDDANAEWNRHLADFRTEQDAYDVRTGHGTLRGTAIDLSVAGATFDVTRPAGPPAASAPSTTQDAGTRPAADSGVPPSHR